MYSALLRQGPRISLALVVTMLFGLPCLALGQTAEAATAWTYTSVGPVEWLRFLPSGGLIVSAQDGLRALNPATGEVRWLRQDLGNASQASFEAAHQSTPLTGGGSNSSALVIRVMEELPGGKLAGVLADSASGGSWFDVIDLATGATVWSSTALPVGEAHGYLPFPDSTSILVYGLLVEPGGSRRMWAKVDAFSGRVLWVSDSLLREIPAQFDPIGMSSSSGTINGNQPLIQLADSTVLLYASEDGPVRFESASGRVQWRTRLSRSDLGPIGQGYAPMLIAGDTALLPAGKRIEAIELTSGRRLWATEKFSTNISQLVSSPGGLLVRGVPSLLAGQDPQYIKPFAALVETASGKTRWKRDFDARSGLTGFLVNGDTAIFAGDKGLIHLHLTAASDTVLGWEKLPGRPAANLEPREDGLLLSAAQSLTLFGTDGRIRYQREYAAPTLSLGGRLLRVALGAVAIAGGAYYSGGYLTGRAFARYQYSRSRFASNYAYFVLRDHQGKGPALGRIDKSNGELAGVIGLAGDKSPEYVVDQATDLVIVKRENVLTAYRW